MEVTLKRVKSMIRPQIRIHHIWVVHASSCEKSCLQLLTPTWFGLRAGGGGGGGTVKYIRCLSCSAKSAYEASLLHSTVFHMCFTSTRLKIAWVQQRQHHRAHESAKERMLSLALASGTAPTPTDLASFRRITIH